MAKITIGFSLILILMGVGGYVGTGHEHVTALIPAFLGLPILICGIVALNESRRKHAMHVAMALALLGFLGCLRGLMQLPTLLTGGTVARPVAVAEQAATAILCVAFIGLGINSFIKARRQAI